MLHCLPLIALVVMAAVVGATCNPPGGAAGIELSVWKDPQYGAQAAACKATAGRWRANLRSCSCPDGQLFSVGDGCKAAEWGDKRVGDIALLGGAVAHRLTATDRRLLTRALDGVSVEGCPRDSSVVALALRPISVSDIELMLAMEGAEYGPDIMVELDPQRWPGEQATGQRVECFELLRAAWPGIGATALSACASLQSFLDAISHDALPPSALLWEKYKGDGRLRIELSVANLPEEMGWGVYKMVGKNGAVFMRSVQLNPDNSLEMNVLISAWGGVMGGSVQRRSPLPAGSEAVLQKDVVYFDGAFAPLRTKEDAFGSRRELRQAAQVWLDFRRSGRAAQAIPTDGEKIPVYEPVRTMVFENGVSWAAAGLTQRLNPRIEEIEYFARTDALRAPFFFGGTGPLEAAIDLAPDRGLAGQHGTAVASILLADLYNARLSIMIPDDHIWPSRVDLASQTLSERLRQERPFVVNISVVYDSMIGDCEAVFGPIFQEFENEVLFIAGAGNSGMRNATTFCPASLAPKYANVVSVGGVNDDGSIGIRNIWEGGSNYGAESVEIAAPFCADVMAVKDGRAIKQRECGTSFSAPQVGNAALRLHARAPWLTPSDMKQLLMAACDDSGIDVACGGTFSPDVLERSYANRIEAPKSTPAAHPMEQVTRRSAPTFGHGHDQ
jgi:hypothetical protein